MTEQKELFWCLDQDCLCEVEPFYSDKDLQNHISEEHREEENAKIEEKKEEIVNMKEIVEMGSIIKIAREIIDDIITKVVENEDPLVEVVEEILIEEKVEII